MDWNSALWGIVGVLGSLAISFVFYLIGNKTKKLIYTINSQSLITDKLSDIEGLNITYKEKSINCLISTTINLKSIGKDNISMDDFANVDPLRITTDGEFLFLNDIQSALTNNSNPANLVKLNVSNDLTTIEIDYDYFSKNSLITLNLLHTGELSVHGTMKKGKLSPSNSINKQNLSDVFTSIGISLGIVFIIFCSTIINGADFFFSQMITFFFNLLLGILLINIYIQSKK